jgi:hypothetical protein
VRRWARARARALHRDGKRSAANLLRAIAEELAIGAKVVDRRAVVTIGRAAGIGERPARITLGKLAALGDIVRVRDRGNWCGYGSRTAAMLIPATWGELWRLRPARAAFAQACLDLRGLRADLEARGFHVPAIALAGAPGTHTAPAARAIGPPVAAQVPPVAGLAFQGTPATGGGSGPAGGPDAAPLEDPARVRGIDRSPFVLGDPDHDRNRSRIGSQILPLTPPPTQNGCAELERPPPPGAGCGGAFGAPDQNLGAATGARAPRPPRARERRAEQGSGRAIVVPPALRGAPASVVVAWFESQGLDHREAVRRVYAFQRAAGKRAARAAAGETGRKPRVRAAARRELAAIRRDARAAEREEGGR